MNDIDGVIGSGSAWLPWDRGQGMGGRALRASSTHLQRRHHKMPSREREGFRSASCDNSVTSVSLAVHGRSVEFHPAWGVDQFAMPPAYDASHVIRRSFQ